MKHRALLAGFVLAGWAGAAEPDLMNLGQGITAYTAKNYDSAIQYLKAAPPVPRLADYATYYLASSEQQLHDYDGAVALLGAYREHPVAASPLAGKISLLQARVLLDKSQPATAVKALEILQKDYKLLPQPDGDFALGMAYEAQGEKQQAAISYQKVFYSYPNTDLAAQAWLVMERLRAAMGTDFPKASPRQQLDREDRWIAVKQYRKARDEYATLAETLGGIDKEEAKVGVAAMDLMAGQISVARSALKGLHIPHSEVDAERLYYVTEGARKSGDEFAMLEALKDLEEHYPKSPWRLKALLTAANRYLVTNDRERARFMYQSAADGFPEDNSTANSHWKITWEAYLDNRPEQAFLLKEQVEHYPADVHASTSLYFLGRIAETEGKPDEARAYYDRLDLQYPHYFYSMLARQKNKDTKLAAATADASVKKWLAGVAWPAHRDFSASEPNAATRIRIERAHLLQQAGLPDVAEAELRFGAKQDGEQAHLLALDLANAAPSPFRALRTMKAFSSDYLAIPTQGASLKFWQMLFPLPYKEEVFRNAKERGLDPFFVAALIRQESEFNPDAKSKANAYGLMQLIPSTGRMLGLKQGMTQFRTSMLLNPSVNIQLGTQYLKTQLDNWSGDWYQTLAAYNAGPGRVRDWITWSKYREPVEFAENIPFNETREYVQAVLRNAEFYRELYDGKTIPEAAVTKKATQKEKPAPALPGRKKPVKPA